MRPGGHLDPLGQRGVPGHRPQLVGVGAHHVGQHVGVPGVALGPRRGVPLAVTRDLPGVDREHRVPGGDQRGHPRPPVGLDPDQHLLGAQVLPGETGDQLVQPRDPDNALGQPGLAQPPPGLILHLHIMVIFSPVVADEQQPAHLPPSRLLKCSLREINRGLMVQYSRHDQRARHPISDPDLPTTGGGTV